MMKSLIAGFALALAACATPIALAPSPEAQVKTGSDTVKTLAVTTNVLLRDHKITVTQAKAFRNMLVVSGDTLDDATADLVACRKSTGPAPLAGPDPCWPLVSDVVTVALANVAGIRKALTGK